MARHIQWLDIDYGTYIKRKKSQNREDNNDTGEAIQAHAGLHGNGEEDEEDTVSNISNVDIPNEPEEGWHTVKTGRETITYEATPTGQTWSGSIYKASVAVMAHGIPVMNSYQALAEDSDEEVSDDEEVGLAAERSPLDEPKIFDEAWNHPDPSERNGWRRYPKGIC